MPDENINIDNWIDIAPSFVKIPVQLYKYRTLIDFYYKKGLLKINKGSTNVMLLGRPNVGKSVLLSHLEGNYAKPNWKLPKTSTGTESTVLRFGESANIYRCLPGQKYNPRFKSLKEGFNSESLKGIIYVVDFGYTNYRDSIIKEKMEGKYPSIKELQKSNLKEELNDYRIVCDRIAESITNGNGPKWLLILVNKCDLFFDDLDNVQKYYHPKMNSDFSTITKNLINTVGSTNIKVEALPVCSFEQNFEWNKQILEGNMKGSQNKKNLLNFLVFNLFQLTNNK